MSLTRVQTLISADRACIGQLPAHDSTPETLMPEGNKSRVSGDGLESNYTWNTSWRCWWQQSGESLGNQPSVIRPDIVSLPSLSYAPSISSRDSSYSIKGLISTRWRWPEIFTLLLSKKSPTDCFTYTVIGSASEGIKPPSWIFPPQFKHSIASSIGFRTGLDQ